MEKYYKIKRESETGLAIQVLIDKGAIFDNKLDELRLKYGFDDAWCSSNYFKNVSAVHFANAPSPLEWKKVKGCFNGYIPKKNSKNRELIKDFNYLSTMSLERNCLDNAIGNNRIISHAGYNLDMKEYFYFIVKSEWNCTLKPDCVEITNIEYAESTSKYEN